MVGARIVTKTHRHAGLIMRQEVPPRQRAGRPLAQDYGSHGKLLLDTDENRYPIPDVSALPDRDRRLFERFIYW